MVWMVEIGGVKCPASIRMALWLVWLVSHHHPSFYEPYPVHLRLHESNLRHVGGPCEVIGLAMAETRRFASSLMDARGM